MVPNYVKDVLLPLNPEQEAAMRDLGFLGWTFYTGMALPTTQGERKGVNGG